MQLLSALEEKLREYNPAYEREVLERAIITIPKEKHSEFYAECLTEGKGFMSLSTVLSVSKRYESNTRKYIYTESETKAKETLGKLKQLAYALYNKFGANMQTNMKPFSEYQLQDNSQLFEAYELKAIDSIQNDEKVFIKEVYWNPDSVERLLEVYYREEAQQKYFALPLQKLVESKRIGVAA